MGKGILSESYSCTKTDRQNRQSVKERDHTDVGGADRDDRASGKWWTKKEEKKTACGTTAAVSVRNLTEF